MHILGSQLAGVVDGLFSALVSNGMRAIVGCKQKQTEMVFGVLEIFDLVPVEPEQMMQGAIISQPIFNNIILVDGGG